MINKRWEESGENHILYFTPFYEEREVARIWQDEDGDWMYSSAETMDDNVYLDDARTLEEAKNEADTRVNAHYVDQIGYYTELLERFEKGE